ncbi:MAG TPA: ABC transporter ATP-binding protein [Acidimicrobiales bacterium]|nr:ABC transporter ATP-binding protein [Acidimicrobiales bacterium]
MSPVAYLSPDLSAFRPDPSKAARGHPSPMYGPAMPSGPAISSGPAGVLEHAGAVAAPAAVELHDVSKHYGRRRRRVEALRGVSATFPRASMTAVMGLSGSGKSTLLQCAAGLDRPSSGSVRLGGVELSKLSRRRLSLVRRRRVGFVFQSLNLVPTLTVAENIALPLRLDGRRVDRSAVRHLADQVGIASMLRRLPDTLSGGQQQRVAIARALVAEPEVVFADEPTAALDPYTSEEILALLRRAVDELGQTVVVVTHDPRVAAAADRVLVLHGGRLAGVVEQPTAGELAALLHELGGRSGRSGNGPSCRSGNGPSGWLGQSDQSARSDGNRGR